MPTQPKFVIFAHHATYDTLHQVATLGLTAAAMGKDVLVILLFWTIKKLAEGKIDQVDFPPEYAASADEVTRLLKEKKVPKISEMFQDAKHVGKVSPDRLQCRSGIHGGGECRRRKERRRSHGIACYYCAHLRCGNNAVHLAGC